MLLRGYGRFWRGVGEMEEGFSFGNLRLGSGSFFLCGVLILFCKKFFLVFNVTLMELSRVFKY